MKFEIFKFDISSFFQKMSCISRKNVEPSYNIIFLGPLITFLFILFLSPFEINPKYWDMLFKCLSLNTFISIFLFIVWKKSKSIGVAIFSLFAALEAIAYWIPNFPNWTQYLLMILLLMLFVKSIKNNFKFSTHFFINIMSAALFLFFIVLQRSELEYAQPFGEINIHKDTLFHSAIASMIKNYHVSSIGLHGLVPLYYHTGSHSLFAGISKMTNIPVYYCYNFAYPLIIIPLMLTSFLALADELIPTKKMELSIRSFILMFFVIAIRNPIYYQSFFNQALLLSESYTLSIINMVSMISILLHLEKKIGRVERYLFNIILLFLFMQTITFKISSPFVFIGFLLSWLIFSKAQSFIFKGSTVLTCLISYFLLFKNFNKSTTGMILKPFATIASVHMGLFHLNNIIIKAIYFLSINLAFSISVTILGICYYLRETLKTTFPIWFFFGIFICSIIGIIPSLLWQFPGGAQLFFANATQALSLPFLIILPSVLMEEVGSFERTPLEILKKLFCKKSLETLLIIFYTGNFLFGFIPTIPKIYQASQILIKGMETKVTIFDTAQIVSLLKVRNDEKTLNKIIYIDRNQNNFWNLFDCHTNSFLIPALAERPGLYTFPNSECIAENYGIDDYSIYRKEIFSLSYSDDYLLKMSNKMGIDGVILIKGNEIRTISK